MTLTYPCCEGIVTRKMRRVNHVAVETWIIYSQSGGCANLNGLSIIISPIIYTIHYIYDDYSWSDPPITH